MSLIDSSCFAMLFIEKRITFDTLLFSEESTETTAEKRSADEENGEDESPTKKVKTTEGESEKQEKEEKSESA